MNQAKVAALKTVYRHRQEAVEKLTGDDQGRIFASPVANSDDGLGAPLTSANQSWQPFFNKTYQDGTLTEINMPKAEVGFAIASHYLWMAEGERTVTLTIFGFTAAVPFEVADEITCLFTSPKGWKERPLKTLTQITAYELELTVTLSGNDPAVTPYDAKVHGYGFATNLPLLLVKIKHTDKPYIYNCFQDTEITNITLTVEVSGVRTLAVSNDFGPVDISKPFLPFGASPITGSALIIGSKEVFQKVQKNLSSFKLAITWQPKGTSYSAGEGTQAPTITATWLENGLWGNSETLTPFSSNDDEFNFVSFDNTLLNASDFTPDFTANGFYGTNSRNGFVRLALDSDFGQVDYQTALRDYLITASKKPPDSTLGTAPIAPTIPMIESLSVHYKATQNIDLSSKDTYANRQARFFHLAPFGQAEQHPFLNTAKKVFLLPQFDFQGDNAKQESEAELYVGVTDLKPPQNLALLFQVADGTADPQSKKPDPPIHLHWSYLRGNEWIPFAQNEVEDRTGGLINSGIITFAMPRDASADNTLLPGGMHWIRAAVASASAAVCRLLLIGSQALAATFTDQGNDPAFSARVLRPGTISKLDQPDAAVKKISQPFPTFGGRGQEAPTAFYTRVSERLRHKDRAIALWDYERLSLGDLSPNLQGQMPEPH